MILFTLVAYICFFCVNTVTTENRILLPPLTFVDRSLIVCPFLVWKQNQACWAGHYPLTWSWLHIVAPGLVVDNSHTRSLHGSICDNENACHVRLLRCLDYMWLPGWDMAYPVGHLRFVWLSFKPRVVAASDLFASECSGCYMHVNLSSVCVLLWLKAGLCLQSGSQKSPHLWPWHSWSTTNHLRVPRADDKPLSAVLFPQVFLSHFLLTPHFHHLRCSLVPSLQPLGHDALWPTLQPDVMLICLHELIEGYMRKSHYSQ